jgi:superfamily II DNA or RNA helicase
VGQVDSLIRLKPGELTKRQERHIKASLTFHPQEGVTVSSYRPKASGGLWLPRGAWQYLPASVTLRDKRSFPKFPKLDTKIVLDFKSDEKEFVGQHDCVQAMFNPVNNQQGVIHRQPGTGKTQIMLYFVAKVGTRSLVIVHTEDILNQWYEYAQEAIPGIDIGIIRQKQEDIGHLTIATLQTLHARQYPIEFWRLFGCTFLDECHHAPAKTFDETLHNVTSRYKFGASASHTRADKMEKLVDFTFGATIHDLPFASPVPVTVEKVKSEFHKPIKGGMSGPIWLKRKKWQGLLKALTTDPKRNRLIAKRVNARLAEGRSVLVLSRRIEHLQLLSELIPGSVILAAQLLTKQERREILDDFRAGKIKCVLGTQLADEALDVPILSCIALTFPGKHTDLILQQVGRALREHSEKESAVIIDICDPLVKSLWKQWSGRRHSYMEWGFTIKGDKASRIQGKAIRAKRKVQFVTRRRVKKALPRKRVAKAIR